jgi:hypothetical protein
MAVPYAQENKSPLNAFACNRCRGMELRRAPLDGSASLPERALLGEVIYTRRSYFVNGLVDFGLAE